MNTEDDPIVIVDYGPPKIVGIDIDVDWPYLLSPWTKGKIKVVQGFKTRGTDNVEISIEDYTGMVQLITDKRLHFSTKVNANIFYIMSFLRSERDRKEQFLYDPKRLIEMEEGISFFDPIGRLFLNELDYVIKKGLSKQYVKIHRNEDYLKGHISIRGQIQNDINNIPKLSCDFGVLTVNNKINQIILKSLTLLIPKVRFNKNVKKSLKRYEYSIRQYVELRDVSPDDCDNISFDESNKYYHEIIQLCNMILRDRYVGSVNKGKSMGFNFLVNTNFMLQDFLSEMIKSVVEECFDDEFAVLSQASIRSIVRGKRDKPDAVLRRKGTKSHHIIFEIKNKKRDTTPDYFQATRYGLAGRDVEACCLLYPKSEYEIEEDTSFPKYNTEQDSEEIPLYLRAVDIYMDKSLSFEDFIEGVKSQIKDIILELINTRVL